MNRPVNAEGPLDALVLQRDWWRLIGPWIAVLFGVVAVTTTRQTILLTYGKAKETRDVYLLPSPERTVVMSLGYRAAMADVMFAHVLVSSGLHLGEKRNYETAAGYLKTINELDPKFASPYRFADTILTLQAKAVSLEDYRAARAILERGMRELPYEGELWLSAGQFLTYLAPSRIRELAGDAEAEEWRRAGIQRLVRSCELVGENDALPQHCLSTATLVSRSGEREALLRFIERMLAMTDDPEVHREALAKLARVMGEEQKEEVKRRRERIDRIRQNELTFVGKDQYLLIGPRIEPYGCFGGRARFHPHCATSLRDYHLRLDATEKRAASSTPEG